MFLVSVFSRGCMSLMRRVVPEAFVSRKVVYRELKCPLTLRLIRKWLRAPILILIDGKLVKHRKGVPQGNPQSPLLSNIMLDELDKELDRRGAKYVRNADNFSIYCNSQ